MKESNITSMELSKQVVSLDLAQRLKELGVKQESLFYWIQEDTVKEGPLYHVVDLYGVSDSKRRYINIVASAFTVAELGEMLPWHVEKTVEETYWLEMVKNGKNPVGAKQWEVFYSNHGEGDEYQTIPEFSDRLDPNKTVRHLP
jgi:hypothetical protein